MKTHRIYDVSLSVYPGMLVWPGNPPVSIDYVKSIAQGASSNVPPGDYELLCFPPRIKDGDGAPARVFLREL
jgi:kynurenine formamidase